MKLLRNLALLFAAGLIAGACIAQTPQTPQQTAIKKQAEVIQLRLQHDIDALDHLIEFQDYITQKQALDELKQQYDQAGQQPAPQPAPATPSRPAPSTPTPAGPTPGK